MSQSLTGFMFVLCPQKWDYSFQEAIASMIEFCDKVIVLDAGSDDGSVEVLETLAFNVPKLTIIRRPIELWNSLHGKEKLNYFQNIAAEMVDTDYQFLCQADELVHEDSYKAIRDAMETGEEAFMCTRVNLWGSPYTALNVPQNRMPCSPQVIRLSKRGYKTYGDGESIDAPASFQFVKQIRIYHTGFVRKREVMKDKIKNMQIKIFEMGHDPKLDKMDIFDPWAWFDLKDVSLVSEPLPRLIQFWAMEREY